MSEHAEHEHAPRNYIKIWGVLLVLLAISVAGPTLEIQVVTLITAFGIAVVKAYLVAKNFMHLDIEARYVVYLLVTMIVFMFLFFAGVAPDVMKFEGANWQKPKVSTMGPSQREAAAQGGDHGAHH